MIEVIHPAVEVSERRIGTEDPFSPVPVPRHAWVKGPLLMDGVARPRTLPVSYPRLRSRNALAAPRTSEVVRAPRAALPSASERLDRPAKARRVGIWSNDGAPATLALAGVLVGIVTAVAFQSYMDPHAAAAIGPYATGFLTGALAGRCLTPHVNAKVSRLQATAGATAGQEQ